MSITGVVTFESLLRPGERLLWEGRPVQGVVLGPLELRATLVGATLALAAGALVVWRQGRESLWISGFCLSVAGAFCVSRLLWDAQVRKQLRYGLSNRRLFILKGDALRVYDLRELTRVEPKSPGAIALSDSKDGWTAGERQWGACAATTLGFDWLVNLRDAEWVHRKIEAARAQARAA